MPKRGEKLTAEKFVGQMPPNDLKPYRPAKSRPSRYVPVKHRISRADRVAEPRPVPPLPPVPVTLGQRHTINGVAYGPGPVMVPAAIAATLQEQEQRAKETEENFQDTRAYVVDRYLRKIPIAPERFESLLFSDQYTTRI